MIADILNGEGYSKLKQITKENVKAALSENKKVISVALIALLQTLKSDLQMINIIYKILTANNSEQHKESLLQQYMNVFNLTKEFYSFNYGNVHFVAMFTELLDEDEPEYIEQLNFVENDLSKAYLDPHVDWIVVYFHRLTYASQIVGPNATGIDRAEPALQTFHQLLFDKYGVDLVLQAHNHNYERSYPLNYNNINDPIITTFNISHYSSPKGPIFATVGTAGGPEYNFTEKDPYIVKQYVGHGFLNVDITNE